jgi:drug/metabolite transporter (DMT)-like permease
MAQVKQSNITGVLLSLTGFAFYSTHDVIVKFLGNYYTPFQILFFSVLFSFPLVNLFILRNPRTGSLWPHHPVQMALRVLATTTSGFCAFYAFTILPLAQTYALLFLTPIFITVFSIPVLGERVGLHRGISVLIGFVGVLIVLQPGTDFFTLGHLSGIIAAIAAATNSLITRKIGQKEKTSVMLLYPMFGNFIIMGSILPFVYVPMPLTHLGGIALISFLGFVAMFCIVGAYKSSNASAIAPMQYSQILWAGFFGFLLFDDQLTASFMIGATLIIGSGLYIVKREWNKDHSLQPVLGNGTFRPDIGVRPRFALFGLFIKTSEPPHKND